MVLIQYLLDNGQRSSIFVHLEYLFLLILKLNTLMHYNMEIRNGYFQNRYKNFYKVEDNVPMKFLPLYPLLDYSLKNSQGLFQTLLLELFHTFLLQIPGNLYL